MRVPILFARMDKDRAELNAVGHVTLDALHAEALCQDGAIISADYLEQGSQRVLVSLSVMFRDAVPT